MAIKAINQDQAYTVAVYDRCLFFLSSLIRLTGLLVGLLAFIFGGLLLAFFLYFRTAFKVSGWKNVKQSAWIALGALTLFFIERILQNLAIDSLKKSIGDLFK